MAQRQAILAGYVPIYGTYIQVIANGMDDLNKKK
jgi:hypothetical protein